MDDKLMKQAEDAVVTQKHQQDAISSHLQTLHKGLSTLKDKNRQASDNLGQMDAQMAELFELAGLDLPADEELENIDIASSLMLTEEERDTACQCVPDLTFNWEPPQSDAGWEEYIGQVRGYAEKNGIDLTKDPYDSLLSKQQRIDIEKRVRDSYRAKACNCDKYDYYIAATCGAVGGLIDILFVGGLPGKGVLGKFTDDVANKSVEKFASFYDWRGPNKGSNSTKSAIGWLERKKEFKVVYDQKNTRDVGGIFDMSPSNHHLKSLGHSPDLIGLFFSIMDQFSGTSTFISDGQLIKVDTGDGTLQGGNPIAKLFCGFVNWIGHLFSDVAGASGSSTRGSGIPIPFYNLTQKMNFGSLGEEKKSIADVAMKAFEAGYDFRHGMAMAIPVLITELLVRFMWAMKSRFYHQRSWKESIPVGNIPELQRMLLVGHGTLCLMDVTDAAIQSGGVPVKMLLHMNLIAWVRFGHLGLKEALKIWNKDALDTELMEADIDKEYERILADKT